MARTPAAARFITTNLDYNTPAHADSDHLAHLLAKTPAHLPAVVFVQEAKNPRLNLARIGRRALRLAARPIVGKAAAVKAWHDQTSDARAGTGFLAVGIPLRWVRLFLAGDTTQTLPRWVARATIRLTGRRVVLLDAHIFPGRVGPAAQEKYVRRLERRTRRLDRRGVPWVMGLDANMDVDELADRLGADSFADGIVGFIVSGVQVVDHGVDYYGKRHGLTDHPAVWIDVA